MISARRGDKVHIGNGRATWVVHHVYESGNAVLFRDDSEIFISTPPNQIIRHSVPVVRLNLILT